ncbi:hypothetical protein [Pseudoalteromonas viridis]|uniref:Uncharacterized protein n=1 Tax=Pseudoalteromonas viridis TaxID=339617 RepID=A0ABX7V6P2_9GAMM|nr:hypothetical protein [Pseudoalteromonas viridis]QTL36568.1 hypothetical protein J5X90_05885 [Pseudoalteromonas viridis]
MKAKNEEQKIALVISKAAVLCVLYYVVYFFSEAIVGYLYDDLNYPIFFLVCVLMLFFLYKVIATPLLFKKRNKIYTLTLYFYGGLGCAFLYGYYLRENLDVSTEVGVFFYHATYLIFTFLIEAIENRKEMESY